MTPLWINDFDILYNRKFLLEIIPKTGYDFNRKLNSLVRLSIYYSIILYIISKTRNKNIFLIPIGVGIFTVIIGKKLKDNINSSILKYNNINNPIEALDSNCRVPTDNNPFMNPTLYNENNDISPCLSYNNKGVQKEIEDKFNNGLYRNSSDIFNKNNSQRQFYTVPSKKYPNDQESFKNWLYSTPPTCKEGNGIQCAANQIGVRKGAGNGEIN